MKIGVAVGEITLKASAQMMQNRRFLSVKVGLEEFTAIDFVNAGAGDTVLVLSGSAAARLCPECITDAAVVGIVSLDKQT